MIRNATYKDAGDLACLVREAWEKQSDIPVDESMLRRVVHQYLCDKRCLVLVSEINGVVEGMLAASVTQFEIAKAKAATDHCFYCRSGEGRKLIRRYVRWAKEQGAVEIGMSVSSGNERADNLIMNSGFKKIGGVYRSV